MWIHIICGTGLFVLNLIYGLGAIYYLYWKISLSIHGIAGSTLAILLPVACFEGIISKVLFRRLRWNHSLVVKI